MSCLEEGKAPDPRLGVSGELAAASMVAHKPPAVALWRSMGLEVDINGKKWSQGSQIVEFQIILPYRRYFFKETIRPRLRTSQSRRRSGAPWVWK
jgi:hypothetical protein